MDGHGSINGTIFQWRLDDPNSLKYWKLLISRLEIAVSLCPATQELQQKLKKYMQLDTKEIPRIPTVLSSQKLFHGDLKRFSGWAL